MKRCRNPECGLLNTDDAAKVCKICGTDDLVPVEQVRAAVLIPPVLEIPYVRDTSATERQPDQTDNHKPDSPLSLSPQLKESLARAPAHIPPDGAGFHL